MVGVSIISQRENMGSLWHKAALLLFVLPTAWSERNKNLCSVITESFGLVPPILPQNFESKSERVDLLNKTVVWEEVYFDNTNQRGKLVHLKNGIERHYIFDYDTQQIIAYTKLHPDRYLKDDILSQACVAVPMDNSMLRYVFGYRDRDRQSKRSRMYNSFELFRFGGQYKYAFNGTVDMDERGFKANLFHGCIYDKSIDATAFNQYFFSTEFLLPAGGTPESIVSGAKDSGFLSIPVGSRLKGTITVPDNGTVVEKSFDMQQSFAWFKGEPTFDQDTFKIPKRLFCKDYRGTKAMPKLPNKFGTRLERLVITLDSEGKKLIPEVLIYEQLWYNADVKLARRDFTPQAGTQDEIFAKFGNNDPVKTIYDFNTGVLYTVSKATGRCYERAIRKTDFFHTSTEEMFIKMATPEELFAFEEDSMEFKGKDFARDIVSNVWAGTYKNGNSIEYKETYIATDGWHQDVEEKVEYGSPVRHTVIMNNVTDEGDYEQTLEEMNFFKFKAGAPALPVFDVSSCIETMEHAFLAILLKMNPKDEDYLQKYKYQFRAALQYYIAETSKVATPLRVQRLDVVKSDKYDLITFALVAKPTLQSDGEQSLQPPPGPTLKDAVENLRNYINDGKFVVQFKLSGTTDTKVVVAEPGALYPLNPDGKSFYAPVKHNWLARFKRAAKKNAYWLADPTPTAEIEKGMQPGALAALSIAMLIIGIGVGIAIMYLYIRKYNSNPPLSQYAMQKK